MRGRNDRYEEQEGAGRRFGVQMGVADGERAGVHQIPAVYTRTDSNVAESTQKCCLPHGLALSRRC